MKKFFLSLIALCFCVGVAQANSLQTCKSYFDKQFFEKSADCYANFVDKEPRNAQYRVLRSISLYYAKDYKEALSEATTATKLYPALNSEKAFSQMMKDCKQRLAEIQKSQYRDYGDYVNKIKYAKWNIIPITFWVQENSYKKLVETCFAQWEHYLSPTIRFKQVQSEKAANIKVYFSQKLPCKAENAVGCASSNYFGNTMREAKIYINTKLKTSVNQELIDVAHVTMHEIGHAIGIHGHSDSRNDLMYPSNDTNRDASFSSRDINTIKQIYAK